MHEQLTHFAMAFELPGGWTKEKDAMTLTVLKVRLLIWTILNLTSTALSFRRNGRWDNSDFHLVRRPFLC